MKNEDTSIRLKVTTYKRLKALGNMGESFDELIDRILNQIEKKQLK